MPREPSTSRTKSMAKALMRYPYDIKLPDELVEPGYGPLHVPSLLQVEKKLQTINGASAPFVPTVRKASGGIFPFALWRGRLEIELSSQVHVLSETQQAIPTEEYKILLCMSIEQKIRVLVSQIRQELEKANSEKARERKKAKLWSLKTFFLAVSDGDPELCKAIEDSKYLPETDKHGRKVIKELGAKIIKVAVNHYFLDDEEFVPQLVADYKFLRSSMTTMYTSIDPRNYKDWPPRLQGSFAAYVSECLRLLRVAELVEDPRYRAAVVAVVHRTAETIVATTLVQHRHNVDRVLNKSPKEFVREIESYLKENQHHEGSTPAAPALCLSSRLELNTRQKRIYGFV